MAARYELSVFPRRPSPTTLAAENSRVLLLMQPHEEFLKSRVGQNCFHRIERVPKLVMTPSLVDKILTGMARRHDLGSAFTARHYVVSTRRDLTLTKDARLGHKLCPKHSEPVQHRKWRKKWESHPRQVKPAAAFKAVSS